MTTLQVVELGVLGTLQVRQGGLPVTIPGAKPRAILTMLGLHSGAAVSADTLAELLWGADPPRTAAKALPTHISALRRALGDGFVLTEGAGWTVGAVKIDAARYTAAARRGRDAVATGDVSAAVTQFDQALRLWRGCPELPDTPRGDAELTRWVEDHACVVEDRADALLGTGRAAEIVGELEAAVADAPLRERRWGQLMLALYRAGRQGDALGAYRRARSLLADQLGVDPGPELRRLEAAIVAQDDALELPVSQHLSGVTRAVTFLLTDIEGSTAAWEADAEAMAVALARHDEIVEQVVTSRGGRLVKTRGEGDATFSVFDRPSAAAAAAIELQEAIRQEPWPLADAMRVRVALHTGEVELRDGDYFGRAVNRVARLRSVALGGQILCSGATAELVIDTLADDVALVDLGMRALKNLARPEHVFELRLEVAGVVPPAHTPLERPELPAVLAGPGPFVGRGAELQELAAAWQVTLTAGAHAVLIAGEPGVGKTRLAGEWSRLAHHDGAVVLYGRCDEDLGAPYQPFAEALRSLVPCLGADRLRGLRGVEALVPLAPALSDVVPDLAAPPRADPDTERYALFDAVVAVLGVAAAEAPVVLVLDDLHWAAKPTLLLLRHLLRFGENARVQTIGTYRGTDLDRTHPLAAMLADLHRDGSAVRLPLSGLGADDVTAYLAESGYHDQDLGRALASVTGGNPFFLIEALRHVDESGGRWDPSTLPQGVRDTVSRRLSRLSAETNKALAAAAVVGGQFALDLVERVVGADLVDEFDEATRAGLLIEDSGGRYRFNHALVRQSLLAELASVRRMRLHQRIAGVLETELGADDKLLADLAYHYFECAWAGNAAKAVDYCRRAADQAMARLAYESAADLYDRALHALDELDDDGADRDELLIARCEAVLAAGEVTSASGAVAQLRSAAVGSDRLTAWGTCFDGELSMLTEPERLDEIAAAVGTAADTLGGLGDAAGEAKAHTVRAYCLGRLGRVGDCETALDQALTAARRSGDHRRVNAVLAVAPLAALWGPNPVPRAGGRCLDVVRLLRITTGSPVVEATSTRCQAVLDAFRGRAAAGRQLIDSARRSLSELGMRHALLEVDQFAGLIELVADDAGAAEVHLRRAYHGFRRLGLDADTAETGALLARACLAQGRDTEADELCSESEYLAGNALKAAIAWRTVRAQLLSRRGSHDAARRTAEEAVALAARTDALVDHGDACLALATVLGAAGDGAGARSAAERAAALYERKGAATLAERARGVFGGGSVAVPPVAPEALPLDEANRVLAVSDQVIAAFNRGAWGEVERFLAPQVLVDVRRKIVGSAPQYISRNQWSREMRRYLDVGLSQVRHTPIAVRGEHLALGRLELCSTDSSSDAPRDEVYELIVLDDDGLIATQMVFDVEDFDAAMAELDALHARSRAGRRSLENAATLVEDQVFALFAEGRLDEIGALYAEDIRVEDRRHGLSSETTGRTSALENLHAIAGVHPVIDNTTLALRGDQLSLGRLRFTEPGRRPDAFFAESLQVNEIDADGLIVARIAFDLDDIESAFAELEARYLAGEAAPYAKIWSVIADVNTTLNRGELFPTTADWVNIDHRRGSGFGSGAMTPYLHASWQQTPVMTIHVEVVHRLSNIGVVVTAVSTGTSREGFDAEWRTVAVATVDGERFSRCEMFDEADLTVALAHFDQLSRPATSLGNAASRVDAQFNRCFTGRRWDEMGALFADDIRAEDRRRGLQRESVGRDTELAEMRAMADLGVTTISAEVIALRGDRLILARSRLTGRDQRPDAFHTEVLYVLEIEASGQVAAILNFDLDDIDGAVAELDARYIAGEAAPCADTWSVVAGSYASMRRGEFPAMTPDCISVDHRRAATFGPGDLPAYIQAGFDIDQRVHTHVEVVHRLNHRGAVVVYVVSARSPEGFDGEWREIGLCMVDGDMVSRCELFEEADLDAALARFDKLSASAPLLENAAARADGRAYALFAADRIDEIGQLYAEDIRVEDRRHGLQAEFQGRTAALTNVRVIADLGAGITHTPVAVRGERLNLSHLRFAGPGAPSDSFTTESLEINEIDAAGLMTARIVFDPEDVDAAFAELEARYLAGEAAPYARTWTVIVGAYVGMARGELPSTTPGLTSVDHRAVTAMAPDEGMAYLRASWDIAPAFNLYIEAVHRLSERGAVFTRWSTGTSEEGFDAEWRGVNLLVIDGGLLTRIEFFDESDLDTALARFDELDAPGC